MEVRVELRRGVARGRERAICVGVRVRLEAGRGVALVEEDGAVVEEERSRSGGGGEGW